MNRIAPLFVSFYVVAGLATSALASTSSNQLSFSCGTVANRNTSHQFGLYAWLEYIVETEGVLDLCGQWFVTANADVSGVPNSARSVTALMYASARRQIPVPKYGIYQTNGHHYATTSLIFMLHTGETVSLAEVKPQYRDRAQECYDMGGTWTGTSCILPNCPLMIDTAGNGFHLTRPEDGVPFDLDADGTPELVAWTPPDSSVAFLALDRNGNGRIDDGTELFGNHTPAYSDRPEPTTANGFEALKFVETGSYGSSWPDGTINGRDAVFSRLVLWRDLNHNGISEPEELQPASAAGLSAIETSYKTNKKLDKFGNEFRQVGRVTWGDGQTGKMYDVWLKTRY